MISKTHISGQKPRRRQLNKKVCGSKSAIFVILSFLVQTTLSNNDNSKTVQALTLILARNGCSSQRAASQPLSVFIACSLYYINKSQKVFQRKTSACRDGKLKNQPNKMGTTPQHIHTIPTSCAILPTMFYVC